MEILNLKTVWWILNMLSDKMEYLSEDSKYVYLLGNNSSYSSSSFESFLAYYSFKIEDDSIVIFNNESVPYEDYSNNDFSYIPIRLLNMSKEEINRWIQLEVEKQLEEQHLEKLKHKEDLKSEIEFLQKQLDNLYGK